MILYAGGRIFMRFGLFFLSVFCHLLLGNSYSAGIEEDATPKKKIHRTFKPNVFDLSVLPERTLGFAAHCAGLWKKMDMLGLIFRYSI